MKDLLWKRIGRHPLVVRSSSPFSSAVRIHNQSAAISKSIPNHVSPKLLHPRSFATINIPYTPPLRRKRAKYEQFNDAALQEFQQPNQQEAFAYTGDNLDDYVEKANLSPWTPVPDSVARKIFDSAMPTSADIHVELGSGDGRVNFHAMDYGVGKSVGIDVDEAIVQQGVERLQRIHPQPNIEFVVSDLMDPTSVAWTEHVPSATILTMYFAKDGLEKIRPLLEQALRGKSCKIYTCGYAMPGWESQMVETVLDVPIYFYDWGNADVHMLVPESFVDELPPGMTAQMDQYMRNKNKGGSGGSSTFRPDPLPGYHPDDLKDDVWYDLESNDEEK